jgi:hypothetical protein
MNEFRVDAGAAIFASLDNVRAVAAIGSNCGSTPIAANAAERDNRSHEEEMEGKGLKIAVPPKTHAHAES